MAFDRTAAVLRSRRIVHKGMSHAATYEHPDTPGVVTPLTVRWHNRKLVQGNLVETGYADVLEGVNEIVFNREELLEKSIQLKVDGRVRLTDPSFNGAVLRLDTQQDDTGPINRVWGVTK